MFGDFCFMRVQWAGMYLKKEKQVASVGNSMHFSSNIRDGILSGNFVPRKKKLLVLQHNSEK